MENINAIFDNPVTYKGIQIYPITLEYYQIVKSASCAFAINLAAEQDLELIGLPYLEYMMKKAEKEPEFQMVWNIFNTILQLSFKEQIFSFKYENDFLKLMVAVPTEQYNEETMCDYRQKIEKYRELTKDNFHAIINQNQANRLREEINSIAEKMFTFHTFGDKDFEEIKEIICFLNDIDTTIIDPKWEKELKETSEILAEINGKDNYPEFEDLVNALAFSLGKLPIEIKNMTIRRFDRYVNIMISRDEYKLQKSAELNGTTFKKPITHWLKAYKPKTRYAGAQAESADILKNKE